MVILVMNCKKHAHKREWLRKYSQTIFAKNDIRFLFIEGGNEGEDRIEGDMILLNTPDGYDNLATKLQRAFALMLKDKSWDFILKIDDDVIISFVKTMEVYKTSRECNVDLCAQFWRWPHMTGAAFFISRRAAEFVSNIVLPTNWRNLQPWSGVTEHITDKKLQATCIPDDYFFSEKLFNAKFKLHKLYSMVLYKTQAKHITNMWCVHDLRTEQEFLSYSILMNGT